MYRLKDTNNKIHLINLNQIKYIEYSNNEDYRIFFVSDDLPRYRINKQELDAIELAYSEKVGVK